MRSSKLLTRRMGFTGVATINSAPQDTQYFALGDDGFPQLWQFIITIHLLIFYQYIFEPLHTFHP